MGNPIKGKGGNLVNKNGLAKVFGVSVNSISAWIQQGMPFVRHDKKTKKWLFDTATVAQWRTRKAIEDLGVRSLSLHDIEKETARIKMEREKIKLAEEQSIVVPVDEMERKLAYLFVEIRVNLQNIPARITSMLVGETDERKVKDRLSESIATSLRALSDFDVNKIDDEAENGD